MNDAVAAVQSAERRVEDARQDFLTEVDALETRARRLVTSPLVVGGVIAATAATAYLVLARRGKPQPRATTSRPDNRLLTFLKAGQILVALSGAVASYRAVSTDARARHARTGNNFS